MIFSLRIKIFPIITMHCIQLSTSRRYFEERVIIWLTQLHLRADDSFIVFYRPLFCRTTITFFQQKVLKIYYYVEIWDLRLVAEEWFIWQKHFLNKCIFQTIWWKKLMNLFTNINPPIAITVYSEVWNMEPYES